MDKPLNQRRKYYIEKQFQNRFIFKFCAVVVIGALLTIAILYFLARQSTTVAIVDSRVVVRTTADFILPILIQTVTIVSILVSFVVAGLALVFSHTIAGPLYRFKMTLRALSEGDFSSPIQIRRMDQFQDVAESFNEMINNNKSNLKAVQLECTALSEHLNNISENDITDGKKAQFNKARKDLETIQKILSRFKT